MPQMFPMPILMLSVSVGILFLISVTRVFWQVTSSFFEVSSSLNIKTPKSFAFTQTW